MSYLNFDKQEKGYKKLQISRGNFKSNIGKSICYLRKRDINEARGMAFVRYGKIHKVVRNDIHVDEYDTTINIREFVEVGIKID